MLAITFSYFCERKWYNGIIAANEELVTTGGIGEKIGQDDATEEYKTDLSAEDIANIKAVMSKINDLDLNYNNLKDQLNDVTNQLKDKLNSDETKGFFAKLEEMFSKFLNEIKGAF